jgi:hypothetical protein
MDDDMNFPTIGVCNGRMLPEQVSLQWLQLGCDRQ